jgi:hypothetical protein
LGLSALHRLTKRVDKTKRSGRPEISYSDYVEEHKPSMRLPNPPPQSPNPRVMNSMGRGPLIAAA